MVMVEKKKKSFLAVFEALGFTTLDVASSGELTGACPFCNHTGEKGKTNYFYLNEDTGQWNCKYCGEKGNLWTVLTRLSLKYLEQTTEKQYRELALKRSLPSESLKRYKWCFGMGQWLLPVWNEEGTFVHNIYQWDERSNRVISLPSPCTHQLFGQDELAKSAPGAIVHVCEGPWDMSAMQYMLDKAGRTMECVVAVPGADVFKKWEHLFVNRKVRLWFDNDHAGDQGSMKFGEKIHGKSELRYVHWPETLKTGFDVRDHFKANFVAKNPMHLALQALELLLHPMHRRQKEFNPELKVLSVKPVVIPSFNDVMKKFNKWLKVNDDFRVALEVCLATCLASGVPGNPLWFYIVGPAGCGKSVILTAIKDSPRVSFHSSVTAKTLVSGWNQNGVDPSLLPRLDGKTAVFKDGTELLGMRVDQRNEVYATLRGAFDGYVHKEYAQGAARDWKSHFNMLIGVTPAVHGEQRAAMGERFLKLEMFQDAETVDAMVKAVIKGDVSRPEMEKDIGDVCTAFLERTVDPKFLPEITPEFELKIEALAKLTAVLRAQVERGEYGEKEMKYRPTVEIPTRIASQLAKLARMLAVVHGKKQVDREVYQIVHKIAFNSCTTFHLDLAVTMMRENGLLSIAQLSQKLKLPVNFVNNRLIDMEQIGIVVRSKETGKPQWQFRVVQNIMDLWQKSKVFTK